MSTQPTHSITVNGFPLTLQEFAPAGRAIGAVLVGHAMMVDRYTLDRPAGEGLCSTLAGCGLQTYAFDCRGHGDHKQAVAAGCNWTFDELIEGDIPGLVDWLARRHPDLPLGFVGHSLTAHAALFWLGMQAARSPLSACVVFGANLWMPRDEPSMPLWIAKRSMIELWMGITRLFGYFPARRLGVGSNDEPAAYVSDLVRYARSDRILRRRDGFDYHATLADVAIPVLAFTGDGDTFYCRRAASENFLAAIPDLELRQIPAVDHMGLVMDRRAQPAWKQAGSWLGERFSNPS